MAEVSGKYDHIPIMLDGDVLEFCDLKVDAEIKLDFDDGGWYAINEAYYEIIAEHVLDENNEIVISLSIEPFQVGFNSWKEIENDLLAKAARLHLAR